jgi:hypothetical protein
LCIIGAVLFSPVLSYSQHFIFIVTYEQANKLECLLLASIVLCKILAYWADSQVTKKTKQIRAAKEKFKKIAGNFKIMT